MRLCLCVVLMKVILKLELCEKWVLFKPMRKLNKEHTLPSCAAILDLTFFRLVWFSNNKTSRQHTYTIHHHTHNFHISFFYYFDVVPSYLFLYCWCKQFAMKLIAQYTLQIDWSTFTSAIIASFDRCIHRQIGSRSRLWFNSNRTEFVRFNEWIIVVTSAITGGRLTN